MNIHPAASEFPLFDDKRLRELAADITANGQRETIKLFRGEILDGRNRAAACTLADIQPRTEQLPDDIDPFAYVWSLNGQRRDLTAAQRYMIWESCHAKSEAWQAEVRRIHAAANAARSEKAKERPRADDGTMTSAATQSGETGRDHKAETKRKASTAKAAASGTDRGTVERVEKLERERPDLAANVRNGSMTLTQAERIAREERSAENLARPVAVAIDGLHRGDFRDLAKSIPDASVELVFIDPPYDRDSLPLYEDAAREAARILKPGGSLICYVGQVLLPEALASMSKHLRYWWTAACVHDGGNQMLQKLGIRCGWKPIMWFVKDSRGDVQSVIVDTVSGAREKGAHEWQQAEAEAAHFIEKLCSPGGVVVDFFAGGGTTCVAAERLGRKWIAFEIDARHYESAAKRLNARRLAA